jgi:hypothetical protein
MLAALIALGLVWLAPQDAFVAQRDAAAARNRGSARFTIAFAGGRHAFRPGEPIPVVLSYDDLDGENPQHFDHLSQWDPIKVVADPSDGVAWPDDFERALIYEPRGICCGVRGGLAGGTAGGIIGYRWDGTRAVPILAPPPPLPPKPPPITGTVVLNQIVRFDSAGRYRIYMTDGHAAEIDHSMGQPGEPPLVSNILELEITARDPQWEERTASDAIAVLTSSADAKARTAAARTLRFLGTDRAIDEMVRRLNRVPDDEKRREDSSEYVHGLLEARERARVAARMEAALDDPAQPIGWLHFITLGALRLSASEPPGSFRAARKLAEYHALALRRQRSLHKAGTLVDGLAAAFNGYGPVAERSSRPARRGMWAEVFPGIAEVPREVETALRRVAPVTQRAVLERARDSFLDRRFVPMLTRLAGASGHGPAEPALDLLNEIAPSAARRIILADLARPTPRFGIATTRVLPDPTLPALDSVFLAQLTAARDLRASSRAMDRIARYASAAVAPRVQREYLRQARRRTCEIAVPALAYLFSTDAAFAKQEMQTIWTRLGTSGSKCRYDGETGFLSSIAAAGMSSGLEDAAIVALAGPDWALAADAAKMLAADGSARAESPLWAALDAWHTRWTGQRAKLLEELSTGASWDAALGGRLQDVLQRAVAWRLDDGDYVRLMARCPTLGCQEDIERRKQDMPSPSVNYSPMDGERRPYSVDWIAVPVDRLEAKLRQYPAGTTFHWFGQSHGVTSEWFQDFDAPFRRVERLLPTGMHLSRK